MAFLYWIFDSSCSNEIESGFVGVTEHSPKVRLQHLCSSGTVPKDSQMNFLFEGSRHECFVKERVLRPRPGIGWNKKAAAARTMGAISVPKQYRTEEWRKNNQPETKKKTYDKTGKYTVVKCLRLSKSSDDILQRLMANIIQDEGRELTFCAAFEKLIDKFGKLLAA